MTTPPTAPATATLAHSDAAPPGVDTAVIHDLTESNSARMLGVWEDTAILVKSDSAGKHEVTGWSTETGERVWTKSYSPQLGTSQNPSQTTVALDHDAVSVFEVWKKDRLDRLAKLTLIDPTTGLTRGTRDIPAFKREGRVTPWGVYVEPWDEPTVVYLPDGRTEKLPNREAEWFLTTPPGTKLWSGSGQKWPSTEDYEPSVGTESVTWDRAVRRHNVGDGRFGIQVIDTRTRQNLAEGCQGQTNGLGVMVSSPHRTWVAFGGTAIEVATGTIHCNPEVYGRSGQILAISDSGRMFGHSGYRDINEEYFLTTPDGEVTVLDAEGATSTFDPADENLATTLAMTDSYLVVNGRMFALPS